MAAPTEAEYQTLILDEVGAALPDPSVCDCTGQVNRLKIRMGTIWNVWTEKALVSSRLQYLYTKRQAIDFLLGANRTKIDATLGPLSLKLQSVFDNLLKLRAAVLEDIKAEEMRSNKRSAISQIKQTAPYMPEDGEIDPNDPVYHGHPVLS